MFSDTGTAATATCADPITGATVSNFVLGVFDWNDAENMTKLVVSHHLLCCQVLWMYIPVYVIVRVRSTRARQHAVVVVAVVVGYYT